MRRANPFNSLMVILVLSAELWIAIIALVISATDANAASRQIQRPIPAAAQRHQRDLTRITQQEWGLGAGVARAAAQIHQESAWRGDAVSWAGAEGWAQFMSATAAWITELYPDLGPVAPYSPAWAFRAMARYDGWLWARTRGHTHCDRWWFTLRAYNGGERNLQREAANAADPLDRTAVDAACGSARRYAKYCPENTGYPRRILLELEPRYLAAGWRGTATCSG